MQDFMPVTLLKKERIAKDTWKFTFEKDVHFLFSSGQYVTVLLGGDSRDFTIASSPLEKDIFFIVTKNGKSNFKKKLFSLSIGSEITVKNPAGGFVLEEESTTPLVFLAGGIGITPFYSMISYAHAKGLARQMTLIVSFSKKEHMVFYEQLKKIERENPLVKIIYTLSQDLWDNEKGRISSGHVEKYIQDPQSKEYMIAGGERMVENMENLLLEMGIDPSHIRVDIFTGY